MYYADEVRDFGQVPKGENLKVSEKELELGIGLIARLTSEESHPENYKDEYRIRVLTMLDEKNKGKRSPLQRQRRSVAAKSSTSWNPKAQHGKIPAKRNWPLLPQLRRKRRFPNIIRDPLL
jgi:non-homologous end joining protein Ku